MQEPHSGKMKYKIILLIFLFLLIPLGYAETTFFDQDDAFIMNPPTTTSTINRSTYYRWLNHEDEDKSNTIKTIEGLFKALATDIVANEGKGIFYAKNRLGMTEQQRELDVFKPIEITVIAPTPKISNNENK